MIDAPDLGARLMVALRKSSGPVTAAVLAGRLDSTETVVEAHLRAKQAEGLVTSVRPVGPKSKPRWKAAT